MANLFSEKGMFSLRKKKTNDSSSSSQEYQRKKTIYSPLHNYTSPTQLVLCVYTVAG